MREFSVPPMTGEPQFGGVADAVYVNADDRPDMVQLGRKVGEEWRYVSMEEFRDQVMALAKGLLSQGIRFGDRVAIMSRNRYDWTLFDFALWSIGAQPVPVYPTSSSEQVRWILRDSEAVACVVEDEDHAMTVGSVTGQLPRLSRMWQLDAGATETLTRAGERVNDDVVHRHRLAVTPETIATITYTSGTTGRPKGCVLTHRNFTVGCDNLLQRYETVFRPKSGLTSATLLFLPLAHVYGRMAQVAAVRARVCLAHQPSMQAKNLLPDLASFRPTFLLAVPYVFERIFQAARHDAEATGRLGLFDTAVEVAVRYARAREAQAFGTGPGPSTALRMRRQFFDRTVYSKLRELLGGRMRYGISGGSAMDRRLGLFLDGAGVRIFEGYGLTESTAVVTANPPERNRYGTVGMPVPGTTVHIAEDGEVWLRGAQVFEGYHNDPRATGQVRRDGWLATGDIGSLDDNGYLTLTGRKKEIIVTSGGKSVVPTPLEDRVRSHPLVAQCVVVGNDRPFVAALITLDPEAAQHWLLMHGKPKVTLRELVKDPDLKADIRRVVMAANTLVSRAESIRAFRVLATPFTECDGLLTPSLKLRRRAIEETHAQDIQALYDKALPGTECHRKTRHSSDPTPRCRPDTTDNVPQGEDL